MTPQEQLDVYTELFDEGKLSADQLRVFVDTLPGATNTLRGECEKHIAEAAQIFVTIGRTTGGE